MGDFCPIPILKLERALETLSKGESMMLVCDHSCVVESVGEFLAFRAYSYEMDEVMNGVWEITVTAN
jgi:TusA-related sulfurtransferase